MLTVPAMLLGIMYIDDVATPARRHPSGDVFSQPLGPQGEALAQRPRVQHAVTVTVAVVAVTAPVLVLAKASSLIRVCLGPGCAQGSVRRRRHASRQTPPRPEAAHAAPLALGH